VILRCVDAGAARTASDRPAREAAGVRSRQPTAGCAARLSVSPTKTCGPGGADDRPADPIVAQLRRQTPIDVGTHATPQGAIGSAESLLGASILIGNARNVSASEVFDGCGLADPAHFGTRRSGCSRVGGVAAVSGAAPGGVAAVSGAAVSCGTPGAGRGTGGREDEHGQIHRAHEGVPTLSSFMKESTDVSAFPPWMSNDTSGLGNA
jgi:hypothetical protein